MGVDVVHCQWKRYSGSERWGLWDDLKTELDGITGLSDEKDLAHDLISARQLLEQA
jgi:hypothetical protein